MGNVKIWRTGNILLRLELVCCSIFFLREAQERDFSRESKLIQSKLMLTVIFHCTLLSVDEMLLVIRRAWHGGKEQKRKKFDVK